MSDDRLRFWVVAVPTVGGSVSRTLKSLDVATSMLGLSVNNELRVPRLSVGTLDTLMTLSDTIAKVDEQTEAIVKKIGNQYIDSLSEESQSNQGTARSKPRLLVDNASPAAFVRKFEWDRARYPLGAPLDMLTDSISTVALKYGEDLRSLTHKFTETKANLAALNRKENGSLAVRPLHLIVGPHDLVEGEYIESTIVIVPANREKEFLDTYENLESEYEDPENEPKPNPFTSHGITCKAVVPGSALRLHGDKESVAFRVVLMRKYANKFKEPAKVKRYLCREYHYDETEIASAATSKFQTEKECDYLWRNLVRWCSTAYSEVFKAWIHIKVIRVFVEAVLRFGLPINFTAATLEVKPQKEERLRAALGKIYADLSTTATSQKGDDVDYSGIGSDFYPYVYLKIDI